MPDQIIRGVPPEKGVLLTGVVVEGEHWRLYLLREHAEYPSFKLVAVQPVPIKANYRLYYDIRKGRYVRTTDWLKIIKHRDRLMAETEHLIREAYKCLPAEK